MHNGRDGGKNDFETPQFKQGYTLRTGWRESPKKIRLKLVAPTFATEQKKVLFHR